MVHPYITLAQSDVSVRPFLTAGRRFPTDEEFLSAVPTQQEFEIITTDIRRNLSELPSSHVGSPESSVSRFALALEMVFQVPDLKEMVSAVVRDHKVVKAILDNETVKEFISKWNRASAKFLVDGDYSGWLAEILSREGEKPVVSPEIPSDSKKPGWFASLCYALLDLFMPNLSNFIQCIIESLFKGEPKTTDDNGGGDGSGSDGNLEEMLATGAFVAVSIVVIIMVSVMII